MAPTTYGVPPTGDAECRMRREDLTPGQAARLHVGNVLGYGSFACVYENTADPDRVIKLTTDIDDANAMSELGARKIKALPTVHGVHQLLSNSGKVKKLWAIEVEKVRPLAARSDDERSIGILNDYLASFEPGTLPKKIRVKARLFRECADAHSVGQMNSPQTCQRVMEEGIKVYEDLQKAGYAFEDAHAGNWGRTKEGRLVAIDLGYSSSGVKPKDSIPALAGANRKRRMKMFGQTEEPKKEGGGMLLGLAFLGLMIFAFTKANPTFTEKK